MIKSIIILSYVDRDQEESLDLVSFLQDLRCILFMILIHSEHLSLLLILEIVEGR